MPRYDSIDQLKGNPDLVARNPGLLSPVEGAAPLRTATTFATEADFQQAIIDYARGQGWKVALLDNVGNSRYT